MRKLMVSTIIVLPLILLAILLVSGAIINTLNAYIHIQSIEFAKKDAIVLTMNDDSHPQYNAGKEVISFPRNADNSELIYSSSNENVATVDPKTGVITAVYYGEAIIHVESSEDTTVYADRKIVVTGTTIKEFSMNEYVANLEVGQSQQLSVSIIPIDAKNKAQVWVSDNPDILAVNENGTVTAVGVGQATVTVTSQGSSKVSAQATITCSLPNESKFKVYCLGKTLENGENYKTIADKLSFIVNKNNVTYRVNENDWQTCTDNKIEIADTYSVNSISFKNGEEVVSIGLQKVALEKFGLEILATVDSTPHSNTLTLDKIDNASEKEEIELFLAKNVQDSFTLKVLTEDYLGGFGSDENFERIIGITLPEEEGLSAYYDGLTGQIIIGFAGLQNFEHTITINFGEKEIKLNAKRVYISDISFTNDDYSYDKSIDGDVHKGYQQTRVFGKKSYYNINGTRQKVDYIKIPFKAVGDITKNNSISSEYINWKLNRFVGDTLEEELTSQIGDVVTYKGTKYKIVFDEQLGQYLLKSEDLSEIIAGQNGTNPNGITWVDVYSDAAQGYARLYFGSFAGLKESDIQNDYFGNFDEKENWTKNVPSKDDSDRDFNVYEGNSFTFLQVQASDIAVGGVDCHFNFNVLDDPDQVNIFDKYGYKDFDNTKIVLHTRIFGDQEEGSDGNDDYTLKYSEKQNIDNREVWGDLEFKKVDGTTINNFDKENIYGNGYLINFEARKKYNIATMSSDTYGHSGGVKMRGIYNLNIYGANSTTEISTKNDPVVLYLTNSFYCDLRYYAKVNRYNGNPTHLKNTVFYGTSQAAVQVYYNNEKTYLENVIFDNCVTAISMESGSNERIYLKGFYDIFNYFNANGIAKAIPAASSFIPEALENADGFAEWFGIDNSSYDLRTERFVNSAIFVSANFATNYPMFWDEETGEYKKDGNIVVALDVSLFGWTFAQGWTYNYTNDIDGGIMEGGKYTTRDKDLYFTDQRYIRLLCEYKTMNGDGTFVKNDSHITWHTQQAYRDISVFKDREPSHINHLINSLKDTQWKDGSGMDSEGNIYEKQAQDVTSIFKNAILPKKQVA